MRKLFIKRMCRFCKPTLMPSVLSNNNLSVGKRIDIVDCSAWESFGMKINPVMDKFNFGGYPYLNIDGIGVKNFLSGDQLKNFLDGFLEKEKIVPELPEYIKSSERRI